MIGVVQRRFFQEAKFVFLGSLKFGRVVAVIFAHAQLLALKPKVLEARSPTTLASEAK